MGTSETAAEDSRQETKQLTPGQFAELMKNAAGKLLEISMRVGDDALISEDVQWVLDTPLKELTDTIKDAVKVDELYDKATDIDAQESVTELLLDDGKFERPIL